ncbi:GNAT family N-acetyltransferase [Mycobacterium rhizamassiliense]|nr:GNAT family N-acetyltransferase [Mycobacterium rhizamassiliense]
MRTLPRHDRLNMPWQALVTLAGLLARGLEAHSLHTAVRLRIELELLNRPEKKPLKLRYDTDKEYKEAVADWNAAMNKWSDDVGRRLAAIAAKKDENERTIVVENCSALLGNDDIERYLDACDAKSFLSKVTINSGFVAPLHLLTGLLAYYDEEWEPVVDAYGRSLIRLEDPFVYSKARKMQSFIFDCWLLWGPSIPICTCEEWHGEVALQYGYGDENNSLTLRCSSPQMLRTLGEKYGGPHDRLALRARVSGVLKWGPDLGTAGFCHAQVAISTDKRLVLDTTSESDGIRPAGGTSEQVHAQYYSAYLWIAFVMCKLDAETGRVEPHNPKHKWRDLIPFFIHANIADPEAYEFHVNQLARGAVEAARQLLVAEPDLILRFGCAIDETGCGSDTLYVLETPKISDRMRVFAREAARQEDGEALQRLHFGSAELFELGEYSACALPEMVNDYLEDIQEKVEEKELTFRELRITRKSDLDLLRTFYDECFEPEFPDEDERESYEQIEAYLRLKEFGWYDKNNYHVIVMLDENDNPIGGSISDYLNQPNAGVIEYLVIKPEYRQKGCGRRLLEQTERTLHDDADRSEKRPLDWIAAEVDDPFVTKRPLHAIDPFVVARIWQKWNYRVLDFRYVQPALAKDKKAVHTLFLTAKTCPEGKFEKICPMADGDGALTDGGPGGNGETPRAPDVPKRDVEILVQEYLRWAMRIDNPVGHKDFQAMSNSMHAGAVRLIRLDEYLGPKEADLRINEVVGDKDPELGHALEVYKAVFGIGAGGKLVNPFALTSSNGSADRADCRCHLWTIRIAEKAEGEETPRSAADAKREGIAHFWTTPTAGLARYVEFLDWSRKPNPLPELIARIEERMVRDDVRSGEQMMLAGKKLERYGRQQSSTGKPMIRAGQKMIAEGRKKRDRDQAEGRDGAGARGWYLECDAANREHFQNAGFRQVGDECLRPGLPGRRVYLMYKQFGPSRGGRDISDDVHRQTVAEIYKLLAIPQPEAAPAAKGGRP